MESQSPRALSDPQCSLLVGRTGRQLCAWAAARGRAQNHAVGRVPSQAFPKQFWPVLQSTAHFRKLVRATVSILCSLRAGPVPGFLHGWPRAQVQNCRPWGRSRGPSDGRDAPGVPDDVHAVRKDCSDIPPGARGSDLREVPTTTGLQGSEEKPGLVVGQ